MLAVDLDVRVAPDPVAFTGLLVEDRHLVVVVGGDAIVVVLELHLAVGGPARARTLAAPDATAGGDALGGAEIEVAGNEVAHHCSPGCMSMPDSCVDLNANTRRRPARASTDGANPTHARMPTCRAALARVLLAVSTTAAAAHAADVRLRRQRDAEIARATRWETKCSEL